jgi:hypothetical protein
MRGRSTLLVLLLLSSSSAGAWLRAPVEDAELVQRSELIVVARVVRGSVVYVPNPKQPARGTSWHHLATLAIGEVVKGTLREAQLPIVIHYGLTPVVGCVAVQPTYRIDLRSGGRPCPPERVDVLDTGNSLVSFTPLVEDAGKDALWFLRRRDPHQQGRAPGRGRFGIVDPEELQPRPLKDYLRAYLAVDPARAVRAFATDPKLLPRVQRYLDHLEVQRVARVADPGERARRVLPFFERRQSWGLHAEAEEALRGCGAAAGPPLLRLFGDPARAPLRVSIIGVWGQVRWRGAVAPLSRLLDVQDGYWARQRLGGDWWNRVDDPLTAERRSRYGEVYAAVVALRRIGDARARPALQRTLRRWRAIGFSNPQIVEECEAALKR